MSDSFLPPVLLELRANAAEFIAETKEARTALGELGTEGEKAAAELDRATQRQIDAQDRLVEANGRTAEAIRADVDAQIEAERRLAEETGVDYDEEARRAQLTSQEIRAAAKEQIAAQQEVAASAKELAGAQERAAAVQEDAAASSSDAFTKYSKLAAAATAGAAAVVGAESVKMAASFQSQITLLHTAGGETEKNLTLVANGIKAIAEATGTSLDQLTEGAYVAEKAGYRGADALEVLKEGAEGAKAENVDLGTSMQALSDVMLDYHMKASQAAAAENEIVKASGESKTSMQDFASSLSSVVPLASNLHVGFDQVAGAIATMTQHGQTAQQSGQNLANMLTNLGGQNNVASSAMQQLGINTIELQKDLGTRGLTGTLAIVDEAIKAHTHNGMVVSSVSKDAALATQSLTQMLGGMTPALRKMSEEYLKGTMSITDYQKGTKGLFGGKQGAYASEFLTLAKSAQGYSDQLKSGQSTMRTSTTSLQKMLGGMTGMRVGMMLGGKNAKEFADNVHGVARASQQSGANISTWAATSKTLSVQLSQVKQIVEVLMVDIGQHLIPIVSAATHFFVQHKDAAVALAGVIGGVLTVNLVAFGVKMAITAAQSVAGFAKMIAGGVAWAAENTANFVSAIGDYIAYTAAGDTWLAEQIANFTASIAAGASWAVEHAALAASYIAENVAMAASATAAFIAENAATLGIGAGIALLVAGIVLLATHWRQVWGVVKEVALDAWNDAIKPVFDFIGDHWKIVVDVVTGGLGVIITNWSTVWGVAQDVYNDVIQPVFDALSDGFSAVGDAFRAVGDAIESVWNNTISAVFGFIRAHWGILFAGLTGGFTLLIQHWRTVWDVIKSAWTDVGQPIFDAVRNTVNNTVGEVRSAWNTMQSDGRALWSFLGRDVIRPIESLFVGLWRSIRTIGRDIGSVFSGFWDGLLSAGASVFNAIADAWNSTIGSISFHIPSWVPKVGGDGFSVPKMPTVSGYANGGAVSDGWFSTGERGPELGYKSGASVQIFTNRASQQMLAGATSGAGSSGAGGEPTIIHITTMLDGKVIAQSTERRMLQSGLRRGQTYAAFKK